MRSPRSKGGACRAAGEEVHKATSRATEPAKNKNAWIGACRGAGDCRTNTTGGENTPMGSKARRCKRHKRGTKEARKRGGIHRRRGSCHRSWCMTSSSYGTAAAWIQLAVDGAQIIPTLTPVVRVPSPVTTRMILHSPVGDRSRRALRHGASAVWVQAESTFGSVSSVVWLESRLARLVARRSQRPNLLVSRRLRQQRRRLFPAPHPVVSSVRP